MSTLQSDHVADNGSFANFKDWAKSISDAFASFGWVQQNDTGQVVWVASVTAITACTASGGNGVYTYTLSSGPALRIGMSIVITGMTNAGNNGTFTITALGSGTFTVVNASAVTESGSSGAGNVNANSSVPGSGSTVYEIWAPGDSLQTGSTKYFVRVDYGTGTNGAPSPKLVINLGSSTNGAGTLTGTTLTQVDMLPGNVGGTGATVWNCYFSGDSGRFGCIMWRNSSTTNHSLALFFERTLDVNGNPSSDGVTMVFCGSNGNTGQQTLIFSSPSPIAANQWLAGLAVLTRPNNANSDLSNNGIPLSPVFPSYGKFGNPMTACASAKLSDVSEAATITTTLFGSTRTYLCAERGQLAAFSAFANAHSACLMRYD